MLTTSSPSVSRLSRQNMRASTSHKPVGLHGLLQGLFYLFLLPYWLDCTASHFRNRILELRDGHGVLDVLFRQFPEQMTDCPKRKSIYLSIYLSIYGSTVLLLDLGSFISFLILYKLGRSPWTGDKPVATQLPTHRTTKTQNKRTKISCLE
jgi:hypothetical protein